MRKVMIVTPYYYPGFRSGGPQQTVMNIVDVFGDDFAFYILTLNHDINEKQVYQEIDEGWNQVGKAKVMYLGDQNFRYRTIAKYAENMNVVYACGLFEKTTIQALIANRLGSIHCPFFVAPMGVFSDGAMAQKKLKKRMFINIGRIAGLFKNVIFSLTSKLELEDLNKYLKNSLYTIASDIPRPPIGKIIKKSKEVNKIKIVFISRICPQKNLLTAIKILSQLKGDIVFDIYGTIEDYQYWQACTNQLNLLPSNITWTYKGEIRSEEVTKTFMGYDLFLFPTLGENFGHVIYESLTAGCIPVISDRTPWNDLEENKCGIVVPLKDEKTFRDKIQIFIYMDNEDMAKWTALAQRYASDQYATIVQSNGYRKIFSLNEKTYK